MALIKCPECGHTVSDMAVSCPECGYPIKANNPKGTVRIKVNTGAIVKHKIIDEDDNILAIGRDGEISIIEVDKPTNVKVVCGGYKCEYQTIKAGERYQVILSGFWGTEFKFNKVDVIDSD